MHYGLSHVFKGRLEKSKYLNIKNFSPKKISFGLNIG